MIDISTYRKNVLCTPNRARKMGFFSRRERERVKLYDELSHLILLETDKKHLRAFYDWDYEKSRSLANLMRNELIK
jgi:hypothetical protein